MQNPDHRPRRRAVPIALTCCALAAGAAAVAATGGREGNAASASMSMDGDTATYWEAVAGTNEATTQTGVTRTYFIGADMVRWDYAPTGRNQITGRPFDDDAKVFVRRGPGRVGSRYAKCLYRAYTDATFAHRAPVPAEDRYLGMMGPVIRAEVGDTIRVVFRNACPLPTSVHPHGVFYGKSSEGAPYNDGTRGANRLDDAVPRGARRTYTWLVPERAGPGPGDGSSVMWMYHSHTDEVADTYAGLMGPMVVTAQGHARADGTPTDVDREMFTLFAVMDENKSPFIDDEVQGLPERHRGKEGPGEDPREDPDFVESNLMHVINGYVYGNMPVPTLRRGQRVRWYVMGMGTEVDLHTPHWHGNTVTVNGMRMDVVNLLPASMVVADMVPDNPGTWLLHCHVNDHLTAGMAARFRVVP